uniref:Chromosome 9 open reading frame 24 n=1 Tax=Anas platyrhynchos TaxID=8839 RepID=A0A8B9TVM3_ANAPL
MFLFAQKYKTPVSTYTDSYRPPCTLKKSIHEKAPLQLWKENKFVTQGLTVPQDRNPASQGQPDKLIKAVMQEYLYRNAIDPTAYWPEKYWLTRPEASPCHTLQNLPASTNTVTALTHSSSSCCARAIQVLSCLVISSSPLILAVLLLAEREVVADMLRRLSRLSPPSLQPVYTMSGRRPFQGYYSPCSGRHYCLRGMDYYGHSTPCLRYLLQEHPVLQLQPHGDSLCTFTSPPAIVPIYEP